MRVVGVFRELTRERSSILPSIREARDKLLPIDATELLGYLRSGVPVFDVMEATPDPFDPERFVKGGPSLLSDGEWVWREDLAYYVERYRVDIPREFLEHAKKMAITPKDDAAICLRWKEALAAYERFENTGS